MTNEIKFADTVILVDVAYVDRVAGDLSKHFGDVVVVVVAVFFGATISH